MKTANIIISRSYNPAYNLALEEYLLDKGEDVLYLWQNKDTVVIGRNQNPYKECNIDLLEKEDIKIIRRKSGGGAVFHDEGNLNFTLISRFKENILEKNFELINSSLRRLGINSRFNGRNDIEVNNKKISGNAYYQKEDIFCHHGTILYNIDKSKAREILKPSKLKLESKGIESINARILNLKEIKEELKLEELLDSLIKSYKKVYDSTSLKKVSEKNMEGNLEIYKKIKLYNSWEWTFGESPKFNYNLEKKFSWGIFDLNIYIESGHILQVGIFTDSLYEDNFKLLEKALKGIKFSKDNIKSTINEIIINEEIKEDLLKGLF